MVSSVPKEDSVPITKFSASVSESLMKKSGVAGMSELINRTLPHIHRSSFGPANQNRMTSEPQPITASHNLISFSSPTSPKPHTHTHTSTIFALFRATGVFLARRLCWERGEQNNYSRPISFWLCC